jgi:hypothetical protein
MLDCTIQSSPAPLATWAASRFTCFGALLVCSARTLWSTTYRGSEEYS